MFGKLMSIPDEVMGQYYLLLLGEELERSRHPGEAKRELARRLCDRFHGEGAGARAEARFDQVHKRREVPADIETHVLDTTGDGPVHLPSVIRDAFGVSTSEGRRLIEQGGVRLDGEPVPADTLDLPGAELSGKVLQIGRRRFVRIASGEPE
jgi:tyrosyl-tRNA synthetase